MSFVPHDVASWPDTAEALQAAGLVWPVGLACFDLRVKQDRVLHYGEPWPSPNEWAKRWGWTTKSGRPARDRVRSLLKAGTWGDPKKAERWAAWLEGRRAEKVRAKAAKLEWSHAQWTGPKGKTPTQPQVDPNPTPTQPQPGAVSQGLFGDENPTQPQPNPNPTPGGPHRRVGDTSHLPPPTSQEDTPPHPQGGLGLVPAKPAPDGLPAWAKRLSPKAIAPTTRQQIAAGVRSCVEAVRQKPQDVGRCGSSAKPLLSLWRRLGQPAFADFAADFVLVAEAARDCPDGLFAVDMRAEGWDSGTDRSRNISSICVHGKWDDRLAAAQRWADEGKPRGSPAREGVPNADVYAEFITAGDVAPIDQEWTPNGQP